MNQYWYIWFEVFVNGQSVGKGRYPRAYSYKKNAVRRAKQMWSNDFFNPMTGDTISRKWIVSQTCPYEMSEIENFVIKNWN